MKKTAIVLFVVLIVHSFFGLSVCADGILKIGITDYEPMNYRDENGKLIGFDTELAEYVCDKLGLTAEFVEIEWDMKTEELNRGNIDCIWNGMTYTEEREGEMDCSDVYALQCIYAVKNNNTDITSDMIWKTEDLICAVEYGSWAGSIAIDNGLNCVQTVSEIDALMEVESGSADICLISDSTYGKLLNETFPNLSVVETAACDKMVIGFKKGSGYTQQVNEAIKSAWEDGTLKALSEKYNVSVDLTALSEDTVNEEEYKKRIASVYGLSDKSVNFMSEHNVDFSIFENAEIYPEDHPINYNRTIESLIMQAQAYGFTDEQINAYINGSINADHMVVGGKYDNTGAKRVTVPIHTLTVSGQKIDYETSEYPIISYNGIMYFPMTWHYSRLIGLNTVWTSEDGLSIEKCDIEPVELPVYEKQDNNEEYMYAPVADYDIIINGKKYDNTSEQYPVLCFRKITYFPLTGNLVADEFGLSYSFDDTNGLIIN